MLCVTPVAQLVMCGVWHLSLIVVRWLSDGCPMEAEAKKGDVTVIVTVTLTFPDIEVMDEDEDEDEDEDAWGKSDLLRTHEG